MPAPVALRGSKLQARPGTASRRGVRAFCTAQPQRPQPQQERLSASRRDVLSLGIAAAVAAPLLNLQAAGPALAATVKDLNPFERGAQRAEYQKLAEAALSEVLTGADAASCLRLVFNDAATYDPATKTGGMDGSIVLSDELDRPENEMLKPVVEKLKVAKANIDEAGSKSGAGPISWADLLVLAGKVSAQKQWADIKINRAETRSGGQIIVDNYSAAWPVSLGRVDSTEAAPGGRIPLPGAPAADIKAFLAKLGADPNAKPGPFTPKPPFSLRPGFIIWTGAAVEPEVEEARLAAAERDYVDAKRKYDISRGTITRTDYEVDFITLYNTLTRLGAKFDPDAYLHV